MYQTTDPQKIRQVYYDTWKKAKNQQALSALEQQILQVMQEHPEYQTFYENAEKIPTETNPFLHLGLHLAIRDQITIDQPQGIRAIYQQLVIKHHGDHLHVEHLIMPILAEQIQLMTQQKPSSPQQFLENLQQLI